MEWPTRGVQPGEIVLTCADTGMTLCIVAADISQIKLRKDGFSQCTFKRHSVGSRRRWVESPSEIKQLIAQAKHA